MDEILDEFQTDQTGSLILELRPLIAEKKPLFDFVISLSHSVLIRSS